MPDKKKITQRTAVFYGDLFGRGTEDEFLTRACNYLERTGLGREWFRAKTCLDAGCGSGAAGYCLSGIEGVRVLAMDISRACLDIARRNLAQRKKTEFVQASVETVPFKDGSFDFINCNGVLHHIAGIDAALSEFFRILKPQGLLFIGVYGRGGLMNGWRIGFYRAFSRLVPYRLLRKLLRTSNKNEWLDNLCVPVRKAFFEHEIRAKLSDSGFGEIIRIARDFYRRPAHFKEKLAIGPDGMYLHLLAKKNDRDENNK